MNRLLSIVHILAATPLVLVAQQPDVSTGSALIAAPARLVLDSAFAIVRKYALWRDTVTWAVVEPRVRATAAGAQTASDVYPAIRALLTSLGDHHSFHMPPSRTTQFRTGGAQNPRPEIRALPDSIGYISVPAYGGADTAAARTYVTDVYTALRATQPKTSCRWVVDLRSNGGGNMWPMLAGLRPLLGEAGLGSFVSATGPGPLWRARAAYNLPLEPALARLDSAYVAVLTGPRTASSGEAVTISFVGRPRTRSFGLPTRGLSTANSTFPLPDSSMIVLTVSVEADRNGVRYGGKIDPDESIPIDSAAGDVQLSRAVAWLKSQQASCGGSSLRPAQSETASRAQLEQPRGKKLP
jgi:carboxyl-terminal processing protease